MNIIIIVGGWIGHHREHIQPAGVGPSLPECSPWQRLPGGLRTKPGVRRRGLGEQSDSRPDLSLSGPQSPVSIERAGRPTECVGNRSGVPADRP